MLNNTDTAPPANNSQLPRSLPNVKDSLTRWSEAESDNPSTEDEELGNEEHSDNTEFKSMNDRKRGFKQKRKLSTTHNKEAFVKTRVKKLNQNLSPKDLASKPKHD